MNTKAKGSRNERKSRDIFLAEGRYVIKAGASLGLFDLVAIGPDDCILCQVKTNRRPSPMEIDLLVAFKAPPYCRKVLHVWKDRKKEPDVQWLSSKVEVKYAKRRSQGES